MAFQDSGGKDVDAVIVNGTSWAGVEVTLAAILKALDAAVANLLSITRRTTSYPRFLTIITADEPTYTKPDGVHVIFIAHFDHRHGNLASQCLPLLRMPKRRYGNRPDPLTQGICHGSGVKYHTPSKPIRQLVLQPDQVTGIARYWSG